jgi:amino acid permease
LLVFRKKQSKHAKGHVGKPDALTPSLLEADVAQTAHGTDSPRSTGSLEIESGETGGETSEQGLPLWLGVIACVKANVGPAILYLPHAIQQGGWLLTLVTLCLCCAMITFGGSRLLEQWCSVRGSYGKIAKRSLGMPGIIAVRICIALVQSGIVTSYFIFVPANLQAVLASGGIHVRTSWLVFAMFVFEIPLVLVRNLASRTIATCTLLAGVGLSVGLTAILGFCAVLFVTDVTQETFPQPPRAVEPGTWPIMVGVVALAFEGNQLVIPIQESLRPSARERFPELFRWTMFGILVGFATIGFTCRAAIGPDVSIVLPTSLPPSSFISTCVQLTFCVSTALTLPMQMLPISQILERAREKAGFGRGYDDSVKAQSALFRVGCLAIFAAVSCALGNNLDIVASIVGAVFGLPVNCIFPSLIHIASGRATPRELLIDVGMIAVTTVLIGIALSSSFSNWKG